MSEDPAHRSGDDSTPGAAPTPDAPPSPDPAPSPDAGPEVAAGPPPPVPVTLRRAPRFTPFVISGAGLGALVALAVALWLPDPAALEVGSRAVTGYLVAIGALLGGVAGGGAAVVADRRR